MAGRSLHPSWTSSRTDAASPAAAPPVPATEDGDAAADRYSGSGTRGAGLSRAQKAVLAGSVAALVLAVVAVVAHGVVERRAYGPGTAAQAYLDALAAGDATAAAGLVDPDVDEAQRWLLTDAALAAATALPTDVRVDAVTEDDGTATVDASFAVAGVREQVALSLTRDGTTGLLFDRWRLDTPVVQSVELVVPPGTDVVRVAGVDVDLHGGDQVFLPAYPGRYEASVVTGSRYLDATPTEVGTLPGPDVPVLEVTATAALEEEAGRLVDEHVDECLAQAVLDPEGCAFGDYLYDAQDVSWEVVRRPQVSVSRSTSLFGEEAWTVETTSPGSATYTASVPTNFFDPEAREDVGGEVDLDVSGTLEISGEQVDFFPDPY
jgi:hypothetical protein